MAELVLGIGTSHTPMLNAPPTDWPRFYERDSKRSNLLDTDGRLTTYDVLTGAARLEETIVPTRIPGLSLQVTTKSASP